MIARVTAPLLLYNSNMQLKDALAEAGLDPAMDEHGTRSLGTLLAEIKKPYKVPPLIRDGMCFDQPPANAFWSALWKEQSRPGNLHPHGQPGMNPVHAKLDKHMEQMWREGFDRFTKLVRPPRIDCDPDIEQCGFGDRARGWAHEDTTDLMWHDDEGSVEDMGQNLVVMLATLKDKVANTRAGTLLRNQTSDKVYQNAGWNGAGAFALTIFPSTSEVYDHATPLYSDAGSRRSLTWRLPTRIGHTAANNMDYERLIRYVRDSVVSFGNRE